MKRVAQPRSLGILAFAALAAASIAAAAGDGLPVKKFRSKTGGFTVTTPAGWELEEIQTYDAMAFSVLLTPERVDTAVELPSYGLAIVREKSRGAGWWWERFGSNPKRAARKFATVLADHEADGGRRRVKARGEVTHGIRLWRFELEMARPDKKCTVAHLLVSSSEHKWNQITVMEPCENREDRAEEIEAILDSLVLEEEWAAWVRTASP